MLDNSLISSITESDMVLTENGAQAYRSTNSANLDLFFKIGSLRFKQSSEEIINELFTYAVKEDPIIAYQILCWSRDCRGGAGVKLPMATIMERITKNGFTLNEKIIDGIVRLGYWKDIFNLYEKTTDSNKEEIVKFCKNVIIDSKREDIGLFCKWFPRRDNLFYDVARALEWSLSKLRKFISSNSKTVEQKLCAKEFEEICFSTVPSIAMMKYTEAFNRHCNKQFQQFLEDVSKGKQKVNTSVITPVDIAHRVFTAKLCDSEANVLWDNLEDTLYNSDKIKLLPVCDVSDSMTWSNYIPLAGSIGLGLYIAQRNKGALKNKIISFSDEPEVLEIKSETFTGAYNEMSRMSWRMNTDIDKVFKLILDAAKLAGDSFMPTHIIILSDMQFDKATDDKKTNYQSWKQEFKNAGYELPKIIFWNLDSRSADGVPAVKTDNVLMVSGYSPAIMKDILQNADVDAVKLMNEAINKDKYKIFE